MIDNGSQLVLDLGLSTRSPTRGLLMEPGIPPNLVGWDPKVSVPEKEPDGSYITFYVLASKVTQCVFLCILLGSHKGYIQGVKIRLHILMGEMSVLDNCRTGNKNVDNF